MTLTSDLFDSVCEFLPDHLPLKTCCRELNDLEHAERAWATKTINTRDTRVFKLPVRKVVFRGPELRLTSHDTLKWLSLEALVRGPIPEGVEEVVLEGDVTGDTNTRIPRSITKITWVDSNITFGRDCLTCARSVASRVLFNVSRDTRRFTRW